MKKSILILVVALFAGIASVYGQALPGNPPRPLISCDGSPQNPIAGIPYTYQAEADPEGGTAYWYATFSTQFKQGGVRVATEEIPADDLTNPGTVISTATDYMTALPNVSNPFGTTITWTTSGLAQAQTQPLFVVVEYETTCSDNMKVYLIDPIMPFQVNVLPVGGSYDDPNTDECFDGVQSASYDVTNSCMVYDYGSNLLAFEVVGAYFDEEYDAFFRVEGLVGNQTADILWNYTNDFATATEIFTGVGNGVYNGPTVETTEDDTSDGVSIFVWLVIHHDNYEGLAPVAPISLAVAGITNGTVNNVRWDDCTIDVDITADFTATDGPDFAQYILNPRPNVTAVPTTGAFEDPCTP